MSELESITDLLKLILRKIPSRDLMTIRLVSQRWHGLIEVILLEKTYSHPIDALIDGNFVWIRQDKILEYAYVNLSDEFMLYTYITKRKDLSWLHTKYRTYRMYSRSFAQINIGKVNFTNIAYPAFFSNALEYGMKSQLSARSKKFKALVNFACNPDGGKVLGEIFTEDGYAYVMKESSIVRVEIRVSIHDVVILHTNLGIFDFLRRFGQLLIDYARRNLA